MLHHVQIKLASADETLKSLPDGNDSEQQYNSQNILLLKWPQWINYILPIQHYVTTCLLFNKAP